MNKPSTPGRGALVPEFLFLLVVLAGSFLFCQLRMRLCEPFAGPEMFGEIANHVGTKPWQYRILVPSIASALTWLNPPVALSLWNWARLIEFVSMALAVIAFRGYLDLFLKDRRVSSILALMIFLVLPFHLFFPRPYHANYWFDTPALLFMTLGLTFLHQKKQVFYYALFIVATFNRETTCFLTVAYLLTSIGREKWSRLAAHCGAQFVIWMAIKITLGRIYAGNPGPHGFEWYDDVDVPHFVDNLRHVTKPKNLPALMSFMGFLWIPVLCYHKHIGSEFVRRSLWVIPPYLCGMFLVANIYELRIYVELMPFVLTPFALILVGLLRDPLDGDRARERESSDAMTATGR